MTSPKSFKISNQQFPEYRGVQATKVFVERVSGRENAPMIWGYNDTYHSGDYEGLARDLARAQSKSENISLRVRLVLENDEPKRDYRCVFVYVTRSQLSETAFHVRPDFIVQVDEVHWVAFWLITDGLNREDYIAIGKRLSRYYKGVTTVYGFQSGWSPVPGFSCFSHPATPHQPLEITLLDTSDGVKTVRSLQEVTAGLPEVPSPAIIAEDGEPALLERPTQPIVDDPCLLRTRPTHQLQTVSGEDWLVQNLIPLRTVSMLYGAPGSHKSFLMLDVALSTARGMPWAHDEAAGLTGFSSARPLRVAYIVGEGGSGFAKRVSAWAKYRHVTARDDILWILDMPKFGISSEVDKLLETIRRRSRGVDLVIVDTVMRAASGLNLSIPSDTQIFMDACDRIVKELDCSVALIHHTGKDSERGPLGAKNIEAAVQCLDRVEVLSNSKGAKVVRIRQERSKDSELRPDIFMQPVQVIISQEEDVSSLAMKRIPPPGQESANGDAGAQEIIAILKDKSGCSLTAKELAVLRVRSRDPLHAQYSAHEIDTERKLITSLAHDMPLSQFARRNGRGRTAPFIFRYPSALGGADLGAIL